MKLKFILIHKHIRTLHGHQEIERLVEYPSGHWCTIQDYGKKLKRIG